MSPSGPTTSQPSTLPFRQTFQIVIIGAGIVGLTLASFLRQSSFPVTVLEQDDELREVGAGLELAVNASRVLHHLGILDKVRAAAIHTSRLVLHSYSDGSHLSILDIIPHIETQYGFPYLSIHRADLRRILYDEACARGVSVQLGRKIDLAESDFEKGLLVGNDGFEMAAGLIMAADGQHSQIRDLLAGGGRPAGPVLTGKAVTRVLVDVDTLIRAGRGKDLDDCHAWLGPESMAVAYRLRNAYNIAIAHPLAAEDGVTVKPRVVEKEYVEKLVAGWDEDLQAVIELADGFQQWALLAPVVSPPEWRNKSGRVVLVGDAAHACLPYLGQGAAQGLESADALSRLLSKATSPADVQRALRLYEDLRRPRTDQIIQTTLETGRMWMLPTGDEQVERDHRLRDEKPPVAPFPNPWLDPKFAPWVWEYEVRRAADEAWKEDVKEMDGRP